MLIHSRASVVALAGACVGANALAGTETVTNADDVRSIVAEMLADADSRSSLLDVRSGDSTDLQVGGYFQFRYTANFRDDDDTVVDDDFESGFSFPRTRLVFKGTLHDHIDFAIIPFAGPTGDFGVLDSWANFKFKDSPWSIKVGQFKLPFWREWLLTERHNHVVERSVATHVFASIYSQGIQAAYQGDNVRANAVFSDGFRAINTSFTNPGEADWAVTGRVEFLMGGNWKQHGDLSSLGNSEGSGLLGIALHYQGETENFRGVDVNSVFQYTIDYSREGENWNWFGAFVGRHIELAGASDDDINDFGFLTQAGLFVTDNTEIVARYSALLPDEDAAGDDLFNTVTLGLNYYLHGHAAKFTFDAVYYIDGLQDSTITGLTPNGDFFGLLDSGDDGQVALRAQFQLVF